MTQDTNTQKSTSTTEVSSTDPKKPVEKTPAIKETEEEFGGREGPEPTRYGDWEKNGIISDF